jgi:glycosyltransferase involved in cell wall biosynthesis
MNPIQDKSKIIFSIITSVYNNKDMISHAIGSVASQLKNKVNVEHIIMDGNSSDGTKEYLESSNLPSHVRFKSEKDRGIYDALNKGLLMASGDIIGIAYDYSGNQVTFYKNNVSQGALSLSSLSGALFFCCHATSGAIT